MPQLVKGHLRFTDQDYLLTDFQDKIETTLFQHTSAANLAEQLESETARLALMIKHKAEYPTPQSYETLFNEVLGNAFVLLTALARKEGRCALSDLMKARL